MSSLAGAWFFDRPVDRDLLARMGHAMAKYAPDGEASLFLGSVAMIYRPFHATTESLHERQPCVSHDGRMLMWDGRLDNRDDLLLELGDSHTAQCPDVNIVARAYDRWGIATLRKLIGDWAVSIWDPRERVLLLARDYSGVRPLFYQSTTAGVIWCSHLAVIVLHSGNKFTLSDEFIAGYLTHYPEAHLTPYREICSVPPGSFVKFGGGSVAVQRYWAFDPKVQIRYTTDAEYEDHFRHVFRQAVRRRLRSHTPILAELSGGLDSSSIVCMADDIISKELVQTPRVDTVSLYDSTDPVSDEALYFVKIEEHRNKEGHHVDVGQRPSLVAFDFADFVAAPGALGSGDDDDDPIESLRHREGYRVVLSGTGGDEFLGGVPDPRSQLADLVVQLRFRDLADQLFAWSLAKKRPWIQLLFQALLVLSPRAVRARLTAEGQGQPWVSPSFARRHHLSDRQLGPREDFGFRLPSLRESAHTFLAMSQQMTFASLSNEPRLEKRYPFLDRDLIEFLLAIPQDQLLRPGQRRSLMRRALTTIVPEEVLSRPTKAYGSRSYMLLLAANWRTLEVMLESPLSAKLGYVDLKRFLDALVAAKNGTSTHLVPTLKALALELWLRHIAVRGLIDLRGDSTASLTRDMLESRT